MSLGSSDRPLCDVYDLGMLDLDGVVYVGSAAVPGAVEAAASARKAGMRLAFLTNNASRTAAEVAAHLRELEVDADDTDVVTAAQAVAHLVADAVPAGSAVLLVGGEGLRIPLEERGLRCVSTLDDGPVAVVQGFHPDVGWRALAEASYAIESGLPWFASNTDLTIPTGRGVAPGNGSLVQTVRNATGATPTVAGKPERALFDEALERMAADRPLMVGDRLDTDIEGARRVGVDSLLVLTGVTGLADLVAAGPGLRPTYVSSDLGGLFEASQAPAREHDRWIAGGWTARVDRGRLAVDGGGDRDDWWRAVTAAAWEHLDTSGRTADTAGLVPPHAAPTR